MKISEKVKAEECELRRDVGSSCLLFLPMLK